MAFNKIERRNKIRARIRGSIKGTALIPRLSVFRSNRDVYAQLIDDVKKVTLVTACSREKDLLEKKITKVEKAILVGELVAKRAQEAQLEKCVFDRGGYLYHGRIKALAEGARKGGLKF